MTDYEMVAKQLKVLGTTLGEQGKHDEERLAYRGATVILELEALLDATRNIIRMRREDGADES